jgi:transcriptional regulator with XRE-family HTH domain
MNFQYREVRKRSGLTLQQAASHIKRTKQWLSEVERGNIRLNYDEAVKLAAVYGGTPDIFLPQKSDITVLDKTSATLPRTG